LPVSAMKKLEPVKSPRYTKKFGQGGQAHDARNYNRRKNGQYEKLAFNMECLNKGKKR